MSSENREADVCRNANMSDDNVSFDNNVNIVNGATDTRGTSRAQCNADAETLRQEQLEDETLKGCWSFDKRGKGGFFTKNGLLHRMEMVLCQSLSQLVLPKSRRPQVLEMAHDTFGGQTSKERNVCVNASVCHSRGLLLLQTVRNTVKLVSHAKTGLAKHSETGSQLRLFQGRRHHSIIGLWIA